MFRLILLTFVSIISFSSFLTAKSIDRQSRQDIAKNIKAVVLQIIKDEESYGKLSFLIKQSNEEISLNKDKLLDVKSKRENLEAELSDFQEQKETIQSNVVKLMTKRYSMSMAIKYANKESINSVVDKEVYAVVFNSIKKEVSKLNNISEELDGKISDNIELTRELDEFIEEQKNILLENEKLKSKQATHITSLKKKHRLYITHLQNVIRDQKKMKNILTDLDIVRNSKNSKSGKNGRLTASSKEFNSEIKDISKNSRNVNISKYTGKKTIAPLKSYTITKKFGKYYDEVYKAELFSKSLSLKTKKSNAKVKSMFKGEITFIKKNVGRLKNIVIVKHSKGLHTIYSNLDTISSKIKVGKKISKAYTLGFVDDILLLQATKNNKYIDPKKLF